MTDYDACQIAVLPFTNSILLFARSKQCYFLDFLLLHHEKFNERVGYFSEKHQENRERTINANELRSWLERCTVSTPDHPDVPSAWDFKARFPGMPIHARRATMKDAIGKARAYLTARSTWEMSRKTIGKPGLPEAEDFPTFYTGAFELELSE